MTATRIILGTMLAIVFAALIAGDYFLDINVNGNPIPIVIPALTVAACVLCLLEFFRMSRAAGCKPVVYPAVLFGAVLPASEWFNPLYGHLLPAGIHAGTAVCFLFVVVLLGTAVFKRNERPSWSDISVTCLGFFYVAYLFAYMIRLRVWCGFWPIVLLLASAKAADIGAYFAGKTLGRTKLAPVISPKKTVEGLAGGAILGFAAALAVFYLSPLGGDFPTGAIFAGAALLPFGAQLGDLFESVLKRSFGAKDSAAMLPEFGGMLDMADSLMLNAPLIYYVFILFKMGT